MNLSDEQLLRFLDGNLPEEQAEAVRAQVAGDAQTAARYLELAEDEARIKDLLESEFTADAVHTNAAESKGGAESKPILSSTLSTATRSWTPFHLAGAIAATLVLAVGLWIFAFNSGETTNRTPRPVATNPQLKQVKKELDVAPPLPQKTFPENIDPSSEHIQVTLVSGKVRRIDPASGEAPLPMGANEMTSRQDLVNTGPTPALLRLADGSRIYLRSGARLSLKHEKGLLIALKKGAVFCSVEKQPAGKEFSVQTNHGRAKAIGTAFGVHVTDKETHLDVLEGLVGFGKKGNELNVSGGYSGVVTRYGQPSSKPSDVETLLTWRDPAHQPGTIFFRDFNFPPTSWMMRGTLIQLQEGKQTVSAAASIPFPKGKAAKDHPLPDQFLLFHSLGILNGGYGRLFMPKQEWTMHLRLRGKTAQGRLMLFLNSGRPLRHGTSDMQVPRNGFERNLGQLKGGWQNLRIKSSDFRPVFNQGPQTPDRTPIWRIEFWGIGTDTFYLDRISIVAPGD